MYFRALHSVMCERLRSGCCVEDTSSGIGSLTRGVGGPRVIRLCFRACCGDFIMNYLCVLRLRSFVLALYTWTIYS